MPKKINRNEISEALNLIAYSLTTKFNYVTGGADSGTILDTFHNLGVKQIAESLDGVAEAIRELARAVNAHTDL